MIQERKIFIIKCLKCATDSRQRANERRDIASNSYTNTYVLVVIRTYTYTRPLINIVIVYIVSFNGTFNKYLQCSKAFQFSKSILVNCL